MKVTGYGSITSNSPAKRTGGTGSTTSFADVLASQESELSSPAASISDVAATAALNNLLALQEISEEDVKRKKLALQGKNMLDSLETLRRQLLAGAVPMHTLQDLKRQLDLKKQSVIDPELISLIEDIELRAAVELAKLEMAKPRE